MNLLVLNSGSSSIKYKLFEGLEGGPVSWGLLERIGETASRLTYHWRQKEAVEQVDVITQPVQDHRQALELIGLTLRGSGILPDPTHLDGIAHRVVHGGEIFREPVIITEQVMAAIRETIPLAPLHNPANLIGIEVAREFAHQVPQVAVFDTAFHQSLPQHAYLYALPYSYYEDLQVRRYGFHGISHQYITREAARLLGRKPDDVNLISLHLGNGASVTAVRGGRSVDTSMGMTPLEGLVMGSRCGDLDPSIPGYLERRHAAESAAEVEVLLNQDSGLKGICGISDMREIRRLAEAGDKRARLAIDIFCYRIRKYIASYLAVLGPVDAMVFTGGIGENSPQIREQSCRGLTHLGILLDEARNGQPIAQAAEVQANESQCKIMVIRSDEELEIARQTANLLSVSSD
jgi:acetate kinase